MSEKQGVVLKMVDGSVWLVWAEIERIAEGVRKAQAVGSSSMLELRVDDRTVWLNADHVVSIAPRDLP